MYSDNGPDVNTLFVAMPTWQALAFLRNKREAFARLRNGHQPIASELMLTGDGDLHMFYLSSDAIKFGDEHLPCEYTVVHVNLYTADKFAMTAQGQLNGDARHPQTGVRCWKFNREGVAALEPVCTLLMGEIRHGAPTVNQPVTEFGAGPLGNGGC